MFRLYNYACSHGLITEAESVLVEKNSCFFKTFWRNIIQEIFFNEYGLVEGGISADIMLDTPNAKRRIINATGLDNVTDFFHLEIKNALIKQQNIRRAALHELSLVFTAHLNDDKEEMEYLHSIPGLFILKLDSMYVN